MLKYSPGIKISLFFMNKKPNQISISSEYITLGQFLKFADIIYSGGEAKAFLATHEVIINGELDCRRGRKLRTGDVIEIEGSKFEIK